MSCDNTIATAHKQCYFACRWNEIFSSAGGSLTSVRNLSKPGRLEIVVVRFALKAKVLSGLWNPGGSRRAGENSYLFRSHGPNTLCSGNFPPTVGFLLPFGCLCMTNK